MYNSKISFEMFTFHFIFHCIHFHNCQLIVILYTYMCKTIETVLHLIWPCGYRQYDEYQFWSKSIPIIHTFIIYHYITVINCKSFLYWFDKSTFSRYKNQKYQTQNGRSLIIWKMKNPNASNESKRLSKREDTATKLLTVLVVSRNNTRLLWVLEICLWFQELKYK